jgi:hypothetical protein
MEEDEHPNQQPEPDVPDANTELQSESMDQDSEVWLRNIEEFSLDTGHLSIRATGNSVARPIFPSDEMPAERANFTPIKPPDNRSYVEQLMDPNKDWDKPKAQRTPELAERICAWFSKDIAGSISQNKEYFLGFVQDSVSGTDAFCSNYVAMRAARVNGADKYFHCMANCEAASSGRVGSAVAHTISTARELTDLPRNLNKIGWERAIKDMKEDLSANRTGRNGAYNGVRCQDACGQFHIKGL